MSVAATAAWASSRCVSWSAACPPSGTGSPTTAGGSMGRPPSSARLSRCRSTPRDPDRELALASRRGWQAMPVSGIYLRDGAEYIRMRDTPYQAEDVLQELIAHHPRMLGGEDDEHGRLILVR